MNFRNLQNMVIECPRCGKELGAGNISPIDGNSEFLLECSRCSMVTTIKFFSPKEEEDFQETKDKEEAKCQSDYSKEYPYGNSIEPYDIWKEEQLCEE